MIIGDDEWVLYDSLRLYFFRIAATIFIFLYISLFFLVLLSLFSWFTSFWFLLSVQCFLHHAFSDYVFHYHYVSAYACICLFGISIRVRFSFIVFINLSIVLLSFFIFFASSSNIAFLGSPAYIYFIYLLTQVSHPYKATLSGHSI